MGEYRDYTESISSFYTSKVMDFTFICYATTEKRSGRYKVVAELVLKNINKTFDKEHFVVKNFSLEVKDKEFVILVGPSGCGKSTTLRMIAGLEEISSGQLWIDGKTCNHVDAKDRELSMVFQNYALYPHMTVYDNLAFALTIRREKKDVIRKKVMQVAKLLEIEELLKNKPKELSGGQKQRVAIGSAIIRNPKALLMDEPLSNLDAKLRTKLRVELAKLHRDLGMTIIYVTHDQTEAMTLGTRIVVMKDGLVQQIDTPQNLYTNPKNLFVATFIGSPAMNLFDATIKKQNESGYVVLGENNVELTKYHVWRAEDELLMGEEVTIGIRPEDIYDADSQEYQHLEHTAMIEATIIGRELIGPEVHLYFTSNGISGVARVEASNQKQKGELIKLVIDMNKVYIFRKDTEENIMYVY